MYVSGFDVIELEGTEITTEQRSTVREAVQGLVGLEVLEETRNRVVVQDLLDSSELSIHNAVTRMRLISLSMLEDAIAALSERDHDLARDVIGRDTTSTASGSLSRGSSGRPSGRRRRPRNSAPPARSVSTTTPAPASWSGSGTTRPRDSSPDAQHRRAASRRRCRGGQRAPWRRGRGDRHRDGRAVRGRQRGRRLASRTRHAPVSGRSTSECAPSTNELLRDLDPTRAQLLGLVVDSVLRSADYGGNVAETALQKAAPTP